MTGKNNGVSIRKRDSTECQFRFIPGDPCVAPLLSITHEICKSFDCNPSYDVRWTLLDISKALDKVWHKGLIFKSKSYGVDRLTYSDRPIQRRFLPGAIHTKLPVSEIHFSKQREEIHRKKDVCFPYSSETIK